MTELFTPPSTVHRNPSHVSAIARQSLTPIATDVLRSHSQLPRPSAAMVQVWTRVVRVLSVLTGVDTRVLTG